MLARELGATVGRERVGRVGFDVGSPAGAVEDVVGRNLHELGADPARRARKVPGSGPVDGERRGLLVLGALDVGPGGAVDDRLRPLAGDRGVHGERVADVELGAGEADALVPPLPREGDDVAAEHPAGTGDQQADHGTLTSELSPSMKR